mmetsp:Transcript_134561/g.318972  ORF Transcript_134561/g.318972 Transcript_134561/m.318972 type:complete len:111 (-) Transcript_134561:149-481(-)
MDNFFVGRFRHGCLSLFRRRGLRDQAGISPNGSKRRMVFCLLRARVGNIRTTTFSARCRERLSADTATKAQSAAAEARPSMLKLADSELGCSEGRVSACITTCLSLRTKP